MNVPQADDGQLLQLECLVQPGTPTGRVNPRCTKNRKVHIRTIAFRKRYIFPGSQVAISGKYHSSSTASIIKMKNGSVTRAM